MQGVELLTDTATAYLVISGVFGLSGRSAPNFTNTSCGESSLRKTKSHPLNRVQNLSPSRSGTLRAYSDNKRAGFQCKDDRCKSVPGPLPQSLMELPKEGSQEHSAEKASHSISPTESRKLHNEGKPRTLSSLLVDSTTSPKPKRTMFEGFRNTLSRKSKPSELTGTITSCTGPTGSQSSSAQSAHNSDSSGNISSLLISAQTTTVLSQGSAQTTTGLSQGSAKTTTVLSQGTDGAGTCVCLPSPAAATMPRSPTHSPQVSGHSVAS